MKMNGTKMKNIQFRPKLSSGVNYHNWTMTCWGFKCAQHNAKHVHLNSIYEDKYMWKIYWSWNICAILLI